MKLQISNCKKAAVQDGMIGLFFEDINYAADGGLYAEMIENRSFSFVDCYGDVGDYYTKPAWGYGCRNIGSDEYLHGAMAGMRPKNVVRAAWSM